MFEEQCTLVTMTAMNRQSRDGRPIEPPADIVAVMLLPIC